MRLKPRYKSCRWCFTDIWGDLYSRRRSFRKRKWKPLMGFLRKTKNPRPLYNRQGRKSKFAKFKLKHLRKKPKPPGHLFHNYKFIKGSGHFPVYNFGRYHHKNRLVGLIALRRFYGDIKAKTFKKFCSQWETSQDLLGALESRLDVCLYRLGFFFSIYHSRQAILHRKILVNGKKIGQSGFLLRKGDLVEFCPEHRRWMRSRLLSFSQFHSNKKLRRRKKGRSRWNASPRVKVKYQVQITPDSIQVDYPNLCFFLLSDINNRAVFPFRADIEEALLSSRYGYL